MQFASTERRLLPNFPIAQFKDGIAIPPAAIAFKFALRNQVDRRGALAVGRFSACRHVGWAGH
jgi:hypothetical protein